MRISVTARLLSALIALTTSAAAQAHGEAQESPSCSPKKVGGMKACMTEPGAKLQVSEDLLKKGQLRWTPVMGKATPVALSPDGELTAPTGAGIWSLERSKDGQRWESTGVEVITRLPFDGSRKALNGYVIGRHPGIGRSGQYRPPDRFIEVTRENQDYALSENFKLRHFLTKNQQNVWPKYVPLNMKLIEKLELIVQKLRAQGIPARHVHVMSGYRTPAYNGPGVGGRAKFSRHTYGDAADIWVDDDGNGLMDDLNKDGRVDDNDAEYLVEIASQVEREHPELAGGAGIYKANKAHGPFTHIDVRGHTARWSMR